MPLFSVFSQAIARRLCVANRLPTASTTRIAMIQADQARVVTTVNPKAHGLTKRITARTAGISSSPPACFIAAFTTPPSAISAPRMYAVEAATGCPVSPNTKGVRNRMTPKPTTTQSYQRLHVVMAATSWARPRIFGRRWARPPGARIPGFRSEASFKSLEGWRCVVCSSLISSTSAETTNKYLRAQVSIPLRQEGPKSRSAQVWSGLGSITSRTKSARSPHAPMNWRSVRRVGPKWSNSSTVSPSSE